MTEYIGYGAERGIRVPEPDAFAFAAAHFHRLPAADRCTLANQIGEGVTASELTEWYFSGCFVRQEANGCDSD